MNVYVYVGNNPIGRVDPLGLADGVSETEEKQDVSEDADGATPPGDREGPKASQGGTGGPQAKERGNDAIEGKRKWQDVRKDVAKRLEEIKQQGVLDEIKKIRKQLTHLKPKNDLVSRTKKRALKRKLVPLRQKVTKMLQELALGNIVKGLLAKDSRLQKYLKEDVTVVFASLGGDMAKYAEVDGVATVGVDLAALHSPESLIASYFHEHVHAWQYDDTGGGYNYSDYWPVVGGSYREHHRKVEVHASLMTIIALREIAGKAFRPQIVHQAKYHDDMADSFINMRMYRKGLARWNRDELTKAGATSLLNRMQRTRMAPYDAYTAASIKYREGKVYHVGENKSTLDRIAMERLID